MIDAVVVSTTGQGEQTLSGELILVKDGVGNPLAVFYETQPGVTSYVSADDPDFNRVLRGLGIRLTVLCDDLKITDDVPRGAELLDGPIGAMT